MTRVTPSDILDVLKDHDVALKLTHGEGHGYYAYLDDELHHYREHETVESATPGRSAVTRFKLDSMYITHFDPEFIALEDAPFSQPENQ